MFPVAAIGVILTLLLAVTGCEDTTQVEGDIGIVYEQVSAPSNVTATRVRPPNYVIVIMIHIYNIMRTLMKPREYYPAFLRVVRDRIVRLVPEDSPLFRRLCLLGFRVAAGQKHRRRTSMKIDIPVVEHCNLRCKCCTAFGPLADESFLDVASYRRDMEKLAALTGGRLDEIIFTGGEPLLHPRLTEMFDIARGLFPAAPLSFITNGVLLLSLPEGLWESCRKNAVAITVSRYPIRLDTAAIWRTAGAHGVSIDWVGGQHTPVKAMWKYPLDLTGRQPLSRSFNICNQVNSCIRMKAGRIYPCNTIPCVEHFNRFFGKDLRVTEKDYLDLHRVSSIEEIYDFLIAPKPFCGYCNRAGIVLGIPWGPSKREMSEWV